MSRYKDSETKMMTTQGHTFAYRETGEKRGVPIIMLNHLTGTLDDWDPSIIDGLAESRLVIAFDNTGVGRSSGKVSNSVDEMAKDAELFIRSLGYDKVDLFGYSLGGFVAQRLAVQNPALVRKMILAGTGPEGGKYEEIGSVLQEAIQRAKTEHKDSKKFLFFTSSGVSQEAADSFLERLHERHKDKDIPMTLEAIQAQVEAIRNFGKSSGIAPTKSIQQPVLVANGDHDVMIPSVNSLNLFEQLPNAELSIFPDAGHGGIFQYHKNFVVQANQFLSS